MSTSDAATTALVLGVDVEELYILLAEGVQAANNGLPRGTFEGAERKRDRTREAMLRAAIPADIVQGFEAAVATLRPSQPGPPSEQFVEETISASEKLGELMPDIRDGLAEPAGKAFDVGVMAARLHLCLRVVLDDVPEDMWLLYSRELQRTSPILLSMLQAVAVDSELRFSEGSIREDLRRLELSLERFDTSEEWMKQGLKRTDALFSNLGMTTSGPLPIAASQVEASMDERAALLKRLFGSRDRLVRIAEDGDPATAEKGQRILIEDCRQTVGPAHFITLAVRSDLALSVLYQERGDLALGLALDVAEDAEEWLGPEDPATAGAQYVALLVLMATRDFEEVSRYFIDKLRWLADEDPAALDEDLVDLQSNLLDLIGGS